MRKNGVLAYLHGDHLGSNFATTNSSGNFSGQEWYHAYACYRGGHELGTENRFTGQKLDGAGLMYFNARYYDPELGQFLSLKYSYAGARVSKVKCATDPGGETALSAAQRPPPIASPINAKNRASVCTTTAHDGMIRHSGALSGSLLDAIPSHPIQENIQRFAEKKGIYAHCC